MSNPNDTPSTRQNASNSVPKFVWKTPVAPASASQQRHASSSGPKFIWNTPIAPLTPSASQQQTISSSGPKFVWNTPVVPSTTSLLGRQEASSSGSGFGISSTAAPPSDASVPRPVQQQTSDLNLNADDPNGNYTGGHTSDGVSEHACSAPLGIGTTEDISMGNTSADEEPASPQYGDSSLSALTGDTSMDVSLQTPPKEGQNEATGILPAENTSKGFPLLQQKGSSVGKEPKTPGNSLTAESSAEGASPACADDTPCPPEDPASAIEAIQSRLWRTSFDKVKRRFQRQQRQGRQVSVNPILRIFDHFERTAIARLTAPNADSSSTVDIFTFRIGQLCLRDIVPLALYRDDHRSWFEDSTMNFIVEDARRRLNVGPSVAYIPAAFNGIFFKASAGRAYTPGEIRARLDAEVAHLSRFGTLQHMTWPFEDDLTGITKVVMACNTGSHWYCVSISYDQASLTCTIEVYDSSPSPQERLNGLQEYMPSFARLLSMSTAVAIPDLQEFNMIACQPYQQRNSIDCGPITAYCIIYLMEPGVVPVQAVDPDMFGRQLRHLFLGHAHEYIMNARMMETFVQEQEGAGSDDDDVIDIDGKESEPSEAEVARLQQRIEDLKHQRTKDNRTLVDLGIKFIKATIKGLLPLAIPSNHVLLCMPGEWYSEDLIDASVQRAKVEVFEHALFIPTALTAPWLAATRHEQLEKAHAEWSDKKTTPRDFRIVPRKYTVPKDIEFVVFPWCHADHWFAVQAIYSSGCINVYDSYSTSWSERRSANIRRQAERTLPIFMALVSTQARWTEVYWSVTFKESMQQEDGSSCGPITVDNCLSLLTCDTVKSGKVSAQEAISMRLRHFDCVARDWPTPQTRHGSGPITDLSRKQKKSIGGPFLLNYNINYLELICNALQHEIHGLTLDEILDDVRTQIARHFGLPGDWSADDCFVNRIMSYLNREGSLSLEEINERWCIKQGVARNMSTCEKSRLASATPVLPVTSIHDQLDNDYDLVIVVDRTSRCSSSSLPHRCQDLVEAWWRRFGPTNQMPTEYDGTQDLQSLPSPVWVGIRVSETSSNTDLLDIITAEDNATSALARLDQRGGSRVLLLQSNIDGSSANPESIRPVLEEWQSVTWDMMIVLSLSHPETSSIPSNIPEGLLQFALQDHDDDHHALGYTLYWFQTSLSELADLWQYGRTQNRSQAQTDLDMGHEHILHMMVMSWYYKSEPEGVLSSTNIVPERQNRTIELMSRCRRTSELGSPDKVCHCCQATSPITRWLRGPPKINSLHRCARLTLSCGSSTCSLTDPNRIEDDKRSLLYQEVLDNLISQDHSTVVSTVPECVDGKVRRHILASEGNKQYPSHGRKYKIRDNGFRCDPCGLGTSYGRSWYDHLVTTKHRSNCGGRLSNPALTDDSAWVPLDRDTSTYRLFMKFRTKCPICGIVGNHRREHFEIPSHVAWIRQRVQDIRISLLAAENAHSSNAGS